MVGIICGVVLVVLAAGAVAAVLGWRRRQNKVQTVTMSKLIEEGEARGILLEENEVTPDTFGLLILKYSSLSSTTRQLTES